MAQQDETKTEPTSAQEEGADTIKAPDKPPLPGTPRPLPPEDKPRPGAT